MDIPVTASDKEGEIFVMDKNTYNKKRYTLNSKTD